MPHRPSNINQSMRYRRLYLLLIDPVLLIYRAASRQTGNSPQPPALWLAPHQRFALVGWPSTTSPLSSLLLQASYENRCLNILQLARTWEQSPLCCLGIPPIKGRLFGMLGNKEVSPKIPSACGILQKPKLLTSIYRERFQEDYTGRMQCTHTLFHARHILAACITATGQGRGT